MQEGTNPARTTKGELRNRDQRGQKLNFCRICNFQILFKIIRCGTWAQCGLGGRAGKGLAMTKTKRQKDQLDYHY